MIKSRRSVNEFLNNSVEKSKLLKVLDAARWSPSSGNVQNWRFVVISNPSTKMELAEAALGQYWLSTAPLVIVILSDDTKLNALFSEKGELYSIQNCSVAMENMMIEAKSIGLDSCWLGAFDEVKVLRAVKSEDPNVHARGLIALGYGANVPPPPLRIDLSQVTYFEEYGNKIETDK